uniref:Uncharacterized protein n=1 Tax=Romanomermis culicivorax TaxID=13658 RepID=A0A915JVY4_ROMCU
MAVSLIDSWMAYPQYTRFLLPPDTADIHTSCIPVHYCCVLLSRWDNFLIILPTHCLYSVNKAEINSGKVDIRYLENVHFLVEIGDSDIKMV